MKKTFVAATILFTISCVVSDADSAGMNSASVTLDGVEYGPQKEFSGVYFTNFENSKFTECAEPTECKDWINREQEWADYRPSACRNLQSRVQRLNGSLNNWGAFDIVFERRRSMKRCTKKFLNDTEGKVLIERILRLEKRPS
jgi:hypothetical protein